MNTRRVQLDEMWGFVGRASDCAKAVVADLRLRVAGPPQVTTDGHNGMFTAST